MAFHLQVVEVVLQPRVRVWIAVCEVVYVTVLVEAKCKRHDVVLAMFWAAVIIDIPVRNPNPENTDRV